MRAAQINENGVVINYAEVSEFSGQYIAPMDSRLGDIWDGENFVTPQVSEEELQKQRVEVWEEIKAHREKIILQGVQVNGHWFHTDLKSRSQWLGLVILGANVPPVQWQTMDNGSVSLTQSLVQAVFAAIATKDSEAFNVAKAHREAMESSNTPLEYDWNNGWPASYGGKDND